MKKNTVLSILFLLALTTVSFAQQDTSGVKSYIEANFPDNNSNYITPERLRNVSFEVMRSSANLKNRALFFETIESLDSIKVDKGFFKWNGTEWEEVSGGGGSGYWSRVGNHTTTLNTTDSLGIGVSLPEEKVHINGSVLIDSKRYSTVLAIGEDSLPLLGGAMTTINRGFKVEIDTLNWKHVSGVSHNDLSNGTSSFIRSIHPLAGDLNSVSSSSSGVSIQSGNIATGLNSTDFSEGGVTFNLTSTSSLKVKNNNDRNVAIVKRDTVEFGNSLDPINLRIIDGNQQLNHILVSDNEGYAYWEEPQDTIARWLKDSVYSQSGEDILFRYEDSSGNLNVVPLVGFNSTAIFQDGITSSSGNNVLGYTDFTGIPRAPRMTTVERNAVFGLSGQFIFNTTTSKLEVYDGTTWQQTH